jgi:hypothetical protein
MYSKFIKTFLFGFSHYIFKTAGARAQGRRLSSGAAPLLHLGPTDMFFIVSPSPISVAEANNDID